MKKEYMILLGVAVAVAGFFAFRQWQANRASQTVIPFEPSRPPNATADASIPAPERVQTGDGLINLQSALPSARQQFDLSSFLSSGNGMYQLML